MRHGVGRCVEENLKVPMIVSGMVEWMKQQKKDNLFMCGGFGWF